MLSQRKIISLFADQNLFIFPAKNARCQTDRDNHYILYTIYIMTTE